MAIRGWGIRMIGMIGWVIGISVSASGQEIVSIDSNLSQHIFTFGEIQILEDPGARFTISQVSSSAFDSLFHPNDVSTPQNEHITSAYWYRVRIRRNPTVKKPFILEFFDQTIDSISAYVPAVLCFARGFDCHPSSLHDDQRPRSLYL